MLQRAASSLELWKIAMNINVLRGASSMRKAPAQRARRATVRVGRPPKEFAGEVEERILEAARKVFLERGFEGASIDEIAAAARSGKPTIYARFANKRALFTAVVMRAVVSPFEQFKPDVPTEATTEKRLEIAGVAMLRWALRGERMGMLRLTIAEAQRFPDLASTVSQMARARSTEVAARFLGMIVQSDELGTLPAFASEHLATTARFFLDLVVVPMLIQALLREDLEPLRAEIGPHVARSVAFFLAACRNRSTPVRTD
jgi:AcrR family transcriptional regulator